MILENRKAENIIEEIDRQTHAYYASHNIHKPSVIYLGKEQKERLLAYVRMVASLRGTSKIEDDKYMGIVVIYVKKPSYCAVGELPCP